MVTFTCQNCNSCLKKKAVEQHLYKCKNPVLTCIDCVKDFDCSSYSGHMTCITEDQRYGGLSFVPSSSMRKQNEWFTCVKDVSNRSNIGSPHLKKILNYASEFPQCPNKKKKFVNFILNNKAYSSFKGLAEAAFDLISEEYNKRNPQNNKNVDSQKHIQTNGDPENSSNSKRKTISETDVPDETENNVTEKLSKKKDKKINGHVEQSNEIEANSCNDKKKKKKNKKNSESRENSGESVVNENGENTEFVENGEKINNVENGVNGKVSNESKKKKKKNKLRQNSTNGENHCETNGEIEENDEDTGGDGHQQVNGNENPSNEITPSIVIDLTKLSKKEKKKLLKQKKYEAEKNSIENYKKEEIEEPTEDTVKRKKKKQKHQNAEEEVDRKQKHSISEPDDKKIKLEDDEEEVIVQEVIEKPKKFKWDEVIIQVLQTQDDGEMSLKRLSKKICAEYANVYGERESYEEVLNKFNKKVLKTHGVRVHKDKAKLITSS